jgi:hypothetical protein
VVSSHAIIEALADETGCVDSRVLLIPYRHLSPLANRVRFAREGLRRGPERGTHGPHALNPLSPIRKRMSPLAVHATGTGLVRLTTHNRCNDLPGIPRDGRGGGLCRPTTAVRVGTAAEPRRERERPRVAPARLSRAPFRGRSRLGSACPVQRADAGRLCDRFRKPRGVISKPQTPRRGNTRQP